MPVLMYPKEFVRNVLILEVGDVCKTHPYLGFSLVTMGIEFLGKCIDRNAEWDDTKSGAFFKTALIQLFPEQYHPLSNDLYKQLRCGLVHQMMPGSILLTEHKHDSKGEMNYKNHPFLKNGKTTLSIEYFYFDFVEACKKVLAMEFETDKMTKPILSVPI